MRLAIVDDDEHVRTALGRLLQCLGHDVRVFESAEAFEAVSMDVECVIADIRLPGSSGPELAERLRARGIHTPIVLMTGDPAARTRDHARAAGTPIVIKPFDEVALMAAVHAAISAEGGTAHAG